MLQTLSPYRIKKRRTETQTTPIHWGSGGDLTANIRQILPQLIMKKFIKTRCSASAAKLVWRKGICAFDNIQPCFVHCEESARFEWAQVFWHGAWRQVHGQFVVNLTHSYQNDTGFDQFREDVNHNLFHQRISLKGNTNDWISIEKLACYSHKKDGGMKEMVLCRASTSASRHPMITATHKQSYHTGGRFCRESCISKWRMIQMQGIISCHFIRILFEIGINWIVISLCRSKHRSQGENWPSDEYFSRFNCEELIFDCESNHWTWNDCNDWGN
jgi:hypothetical protein